jgi:transcriptional regulator with XRE-family HTH domain
MSGLAEQTVNCGQLLRSARLRHGLDQRQLAERAGTSQVHVSRIERDRVSPSLSMLNRLLEAMGETLVVSSTPLTEHAPGGANPTIAELRADYRGSDQAERLIQAAELSRTMTSIAASRPAKARKERS